MIALCRGSNATFAGVASSGGPVLGIPGRVGPAAVLGASLFVGRRGGTAVSGFGERVLREQLAREAYRQLEMHSTQGAVAWARALRDQDHAMTVVIITGTDALVFAPEDVAWQRALAEADVATPDGAGKERDAGTGR